MNIEQAIFEYLRNIDELTAIVSVEAIQWVDDNQTREYPRIVFKNIDKPVLYDSDDQWQRWRFFILSLDKYQCRNIANILFNHLHRLYGEMGDIHISYITLIIDSDPDLIDDEKYEIIQDYRIVYNG